MTPEGEQAFADDERTLKIALGSVVLGALLVGAWAVTPTPHAAPVYRTVATTAFKLNIGYQNRPFVERFGTIALGIECRAMGTNANAANTVQMLLGNDAKEYRVVDRSKVTPPAGTTTKPTILYGLCAPESAIEQCPPLPGPETQTAICASGYTGSWEQTRTYIATPPPECSQAGPWLPIEPPEGACVAAPEGTMNLPVVCADAAAEGQAMNACAWSEQEFTLGSPEALVRACSAAPCTFETNRWTKLKNVAVAQLVEVCGKLKQHPAPVAGGECGNDSGTWALMKFVPPGEVAGYTVPTDHDYVWLEWTRPRLTVAGDELTDLAGYRIFYGTSSGTYTQSVDIHDPATLAYTFETLPQGHYYFTLRAYTHGGGESELSNEVSKVIKE